MKKIIVAAVIGIIITAVILCLSAFFRGEKKTVLALCDAKTDKVIQLYEVSEGDEFSVEFIHSVNKSPVKDIFVIREGKIFVDRTVYSAFGAGVQTEVEEGQTLSYDEEGNMVVSGFNIEFPRVKYIVSPVYDHVLEIDGEKISLTEKCGSGARVYFELRKARTGLFR